MTSTLNWLVRLSTEIETNIVAIERIKEYGDAPQVNYYYQYALYRSVYYNTASVLTDHLIIYSFYVNCMSDSKTFPFKEK